MKIENFHKAFIGLIALLLIMLGGVSSAHAAEYGDSHHEHDGVVCMLAAIGDETAAILPAAPASASIIIIPEPIADTPFISITYLAPQGRAPPPRAPPFLF